MSTKGYDSFIDNSMGESDAQMSPQQAAQALEMALGNGDTAQADSIDTPADTAPAVADTKAPATNDPAPAAEDKPVVMARDGVHTIPYEQHVALREGERAAKEALATANAEIERLRLIAEAKPADTTEHEQNLDTAQAAIDAGVVDISLFGDFTEEEIAKGVQTMVQQGIAAALAPIEADKQAAVEKEHWDTIFNAHEDADSIIASSEFEAWRSAQPSYVQASLDDVLTKGTANQIVELFDSFKGSNSKTATTPAQTADVRAKAQAAIDNIKPPTPTSLSDMAGRQGPTAIGEQLENMNSVDMLAVMETWTEEQRNNYLNSIT